MRSRFNGTILSFDLKMIHDLCRVELSEVSELKNNGTEKTLAYLSQRFKCLGGLTVIGNLETCGVCFYAFKFHKETPAETM